VGPSVADLTCGIGGDLVAFARAGLTTAGIDLDPLRVEIARARQMPVDAKARLDPTLCSGFDLVCDGGFVMQMSRGQGHEPMGIIEEVGPDVDLR